MYIADVNYYGQTDSYGITIDGIDAAGVDALNESGLQEGDRVEIVPEGTLARLDELTAAIQRTIDIYEDEAPTMADDLRSVINK